MDGEPYSPHRRGMLMRPGMRAFSTGVRHAMVAAGVKRIILENDSYPNKNQKTEKMAYGKKSSRTKTTKKSNVKKTVKTVKDTILGMAETYHDIQSDSVLNVTGMDSLSIYTNNVTAQVTQGTTIQGRQGDQIYLKGLRVKGAYISPTASAPMLFRILVVLSGEEYDFGIAFGNGLDGTMLFQPGTGTTVNCSIINSKACSVLYDETMEINAFVSGVSELRKLDFYVPLNRKFHYQSTGSVYGKKQNLYLIVTASGNATDSGSVYCATDLSFKNL